MSRRLLLLTRTFESGAGAAWSLANALRDVGLPVEVVSPSTDGAPAWGNGAIGGFTVHRIADSRGFAAVLATGGPVTGLIGVGLNGMTADALRMADHEGWPTWLHVADADGAARLFGAVEAPALFAAIAKARLVSAATRELVRLLGLHRPGRPVSWCPPVVDPAVYRPGPSDAARRARLGLPADGYLIGFPGVLRPEGGQTVALRAFTHLLRDRPDAWLVIASRPSPAIRRMGEAWRQWAPEAATRLALVPPEAEPADWLSALDQAWLPGVSLDESPWLLRLIACGVPLVASTVGGAPDLVAPGLHARLVPPGDAKALSSSALQLAADPIAVREAARQAATVLPGACLPSGHQQVVREACKALGWLEG